MKKLVVSSSKPDFTHSKLVVHLISTEDDYSMKKASRGTKERPGDHLPKTLLRAATLPMKYFMDAQKLDPETARPLQEYDMDGDGVFSKEEVVAFIIELRKRAIANAELRQWNAFYWKMGVTTVAVFFIVLLLGFVDLSVAVTALTAKLDVNTNNVAVSRADEAVIISMDSTSTLFKLDSTVDDGSIFCIDDETADSIRSLTNIGRTEQCRWN
jgi:hypothetical protein